MWPFTRRRGTPPDDPQSLGQRGEKLAARFLRRLKYKPLATNYRCPAGEADLIVLDTSTRRETGYETIVFVEVKTRRDAGNVSPQAHVNAAKQRTLRRIARYYLATHDARDFAVRIDIVAVLVPQETEPNLTHVKHLINAVPFSFARRQK